MHRYRLWDRHLLCNQPSQSLRYLLKNDGECAGLGHPVASRRIHLRRIGAKIATADLVVGSDLGAAKAREKAFGLIGAGAVV